MTKIVGISVIIIGVLLMIFSIIEFHFIRAFFSAFLAGIGLFILFIGMTPDLPVTFTTQTKIANQKKQEAPFVFPSGEPLKIESLLISDPALAETIKRNTGTHQLKQFIAKYPTWAVAWTKDKEWLDVYAQPKDKTTFERYGFNVVEWRWAGGDNAYGANEIKKQLRELFRKEYK